MFGVSKMTQEFEERIVFVTGASAGIGAAAARAFVDQGATVVLADIDESGEALAASLRANGGKAHFIKCDVCEPQSVKQVIDHIEQKFGRLDIAFNNAGIDIETDKIGDCKESVFDKIIDVNVKGVWLCMQQEIKLMLKTGGGAIVNTASIAGLGAAPKMGIYSASKHAVIGLTKSAAVEYAKKGIRVNAVCPAVIDTDMYRRALDGDPIKELAINKLHPVGRIGLPQEVASAVLYLSSQASGFTTGVALPVDGGATAI
jgi:NAD(P)-dependent dehydrogenase (short-subunit alcohol dehydrogenase family)